MTDPLSGDPTIGDDGSVTVGAIIPNEKETGMAEHYLDDNGDGKPDTRPLLGPLAPYAKAVVGFLAPGLLVLAVPLTAGRVPTLAECLTALGTALATALAVYAVPNRTATAA